MRFQVQFSIQSLLIFSGIVGFCSGLLLIPLIVYVNLHRANPSLSLPVAIAVTPIFCFVNGVLTGLLGYPAYAWLSSRYPPVYSGRVKVTHE